MGQSLRRLEDRYDEIIFGPYFRDELLPQCKPLRLSFRIRRLEENTMFQERRPACGHEIQAFGRRNKAENALNVGLYRFNRQLTWY
jgi:hypothetical protein